MSWTRANRIYCGIGSTLFSLYVVSAVLLPFTHGFVVRRIVAFSYAGGKVFLFPVLYSWLIADDNKSLPWRDHPIWRHGIAAVVLLPVAYYFRAAHSFRWAEIAGIGALLSGFFVGVSLVQKMRLPRRRPSA